MIRKFFILLLIGLTLLKSVPVSAQSGYVPLNDQFGTNLSKYLYSKDFRFHTSVKPYNYWDIKSVVNLDFIQDNQRMKRVFEKHWKQKAWDKIFNDNVISLNRKDFSLQVNPLMNFSVGYDFVNGKNTWVNTRGFEFKGTLGKHFVFYSNFYENQAVYPGYVSAFVEKNLVVPGQGRVQVLLDNTGQHFYLNGHGFDFNNANGYIAWQATKYLVFQFGHGKNFFGDGYRSLLLSDNATSNLFFKATLNVWHLKYQVLFNQYIDLQDSTLSGGYARKYSAIHYLSWAVSKRVSLSLFDAVVWSATDNKGNYRGFDLQYLDPVIFLRSVEFSDGSPDNAFLGLNFSVIAGKHSVFYGQVMLDEFVLSKFLAGKGYWNNKQAFQLGFKTFDAFHVKNLYLQSEFNYVPPYTYSEQWQRINYGAYNQPLADPFGANFYESVNFARYHYKRFYFQYELLYSIYGQDPPGMNYGGDIFNPYNTRARDYGNYVGQGIRTQLLYQNLSASFLINPTYNLNFTVGAVFRNMKTPSSTVNTSYFYVGLRTSLRNLYNDF